MLGEISYRLPHVLGASRTIEPGNVDPKMGQDGRRGGDISAEQHASAGIQCYLGLNRQAPAKRRKGTPYAGDRRTDLKNILAGLDYEQIYAAFDKSLRLLAI